MSSLVPFKPDQVESEIHANGFLGFVSKLTLSAYKDEKVIEAIAVAASKRNRLVNDDDHSVLSRLEGSKFFEVQSILCEVIPLLETEPTELIELVQALVDHGGADLAANQPNVAFRQWCEADLGRADDVLQLAKDGNEQAQSYLVFALQAKGDFEEAIECIARTEEERTAGVLALSRMQLDEVQVSISLKKVIALALVEDIKTSCGITRAAYDIATKSHNVERDELLPLLDKLFASEDPVVVHLAASLLNWHQRAMNGAETNKCLEKIATVDAKNKGTIDEIDMALTKLIESGEVRAASFAAHAIVKRSKGAIDVDSLDSFFHKLTNGSSAQLAQLTLDWLSLGSFFPCAVLNGAISEINQTEPAFPVSEIPLPKTANEQIFLCRKAIGYLFTHPMTAAAFSVAVLMRGHDDAKQHMAELLFDPLLLSYSGALKDWLEAFAKDHEISRPSIEEALRRAQVVWDDCQGAREVVELEPSENARALVYFQKMEEYERTRDESGRRSIFADLFTTQHLLYGDRSAFNIMTSADSLEQKIMPFSEISISSELPKGIFVDPIGLDMMLDQFRHERMISQ
ncbi:hypothetical protein [Ascidiaceihabitans sp.]|uniref:hypothetical protein n=1 Tax=Ascidiaceihabitans sp. TaxID=1872644 RepID=UPI003299FE81